MSNSDLDMKKEIDSKPWYENPIENSQFFYQSYNDDFEYRQFYLIDNQIYRQIDKLTGKKTKKLLNEAGKQPNLPAFFPILTCSSLLIIGI